MTNRYLYGPQVDQVLSEDLINGTADPGLHWFFADHQGTIRDVTDWNGSTKITHLRYDAFGNIETVTGSVTEVPRFAYTGQEYDAETGLFFYNARYYDPTTGRFLSTDPSSVPSFFLIVLSAELRL